MFGAQLCFKRHQVAREFAAEALGFTCFRVDKADAGGVQRLPFTAVGLVAVVRCCLLEIRMVVSISQQRHAGAGGMNAQLVLEAGL